MHRPYYSPANLMGLAKQARQLFYAARLSDMFGLIYSLRIFSAVASGGHEPTQAGPAAVAVQYNIRRAIMNESR